MKPAIMTPKLHKHCLVCLAVTAGKHTEQGDSCVISLTFSGNNEGI